MPTLVVGMAPNIFFTSSFIVRRLLFLSSPAPRPSPLLRGLFQGFLAQLDPLHVDQGFQVLPHLTFVAFAQEEVRGRSVQRLNVDDGRKRPGNRAAIFQRNGVQVFPHRVAAAV